MNTTLNFGRFTIQWLPGTGWSVTDGAATWIRESMERAVALITWMRRETR
jgi:hypothetical protein